MSAEALIWLLQILALILVNANTCSAIMANSANAMPSWLI